MKKSTCFVCITNVQLNYQNTNKEVYVLEHKKIFIKRLSPLKHCVHYDCNTFTYLNPNALNMEENCSDAYCATLL
jgi:hypothetical protein